MGRVGGVLQDATRPMQAALLPAILECVFLIYILPTGNL